jgi:hypothetical protein
MTNPQGASRFRAANIRPSSTCFHSNTHGTIRQDPPMGKELDHAIIRRGPGPPEPVSRASPGIVLAQLQVDGLGFAVAKGDECAVR